MKIANEYKLLFLEICRGMQLLAETAAGAYKDGTTLEMRTKYQILEDKLDNDEELTRNDIVELYIGSLLAQETIKSKIHRYQISLNGYADLLDPKLKEIIDNDITDPIEIEKYFFEVSD